MHIQTVQAEREARRYVQETRFTVLARRATGQIAKYGMHAWAPSQVIIGSTWKMKPLSDVPRSAQFPRCHGGCAAEPVLGRRCAYVLPASVLHPLVIGR